MSDGVMPFEVWRIVDDTARRMRGGDWDLVRWAVAVGPSEHEMTTMYRRWIDFAGVSQAGTVAFWAALRLPAVQEMPRV